MSNTLTAEEQAIIEEYTQVAERIGVGASGCGWNIFLVSSVLICTLCINGMIDSSPIFSNLLIALTPEFIWYFIYSSGTEPQVGISLILGIVIAMPAIIYVTFRIDKRVQRKVDEANEIYPVFAEFYKEWRKFKAVQARNRGLAAGALGAVFIGSLAMEAHRKNKRDGIY